MGIQVEFNPDLALRHMDHHKRGERKPEECIPENLEVGQVYEFLKSDQRNYWLEGELPLLETQGNAQLSRPVASIVILEATHFRKDGKLFTKGKYEVKAVFDPADPTVRFESYARKQ